MQSRNDSWLTRRPNQANGTAKRHRIVITPERLRAAFEIIGIVGALVSVFFLYLANQQQLEQSRAKI